MTTIPTGIPTTSTIATTTSSSDSSASSSSGLNQDDFLKLLVAQLEYQDPSSPMDSSQFMEQTAQYTLVEKMNEMYSASQSSLSLQQGMAASALVGKTVTYTADSGDTVSGLVQSASFGGSGASEPTVHVNNTDVPLSSITTVASS